MQRGFKIEKFMLYVEFELLKKILVPLVWEMKGEAMMTINHAGILSREYFVSYMKLMMNARECSLEQAKEMTFQRLFGSEEKSLGKTSYQSFLHAYEELKNLNGECCHAV